MATWKDQYRVGQAVNVRSFSDSQAWVAATIVKLTDGGTLLVEYKSGDRFQVTRKDDICPARDDSDKPYVENYPFLRDWLARHEGRCAWQIPLGDANKPEAYVEGWFVRATMVVILVRARKMGWDIFTASNTNLIAETLADADRRIA